MMLGLLICLPLVLPPDDPPDLQLVRAWEVAGTSQDGEFGSELAFLGDIDFDGIADLLVTAPGARRDDGLPGEGAVHLLSGADGRVLWTIQGEAAGQALGRGLAVLDDVNVDGRPDFAVLSRSELRDNGGDGWRIAAEIRSGRDGSVLRPLVSARRDERLGGPLVATGDVDGDGHGDLLVGSVADEDGIVDVAPRPGIAVLFSSMTGRELRRFTGETWDFGRVVLGRSQLGDNAGAAFAIGDESRQRLAVWSTASDAPAFEASLPQDRSASFRAAAPGDVDQDGRPDFLVLTFVARGCPGGTGTSPREAPRFAIQSGKDGRLLGELAWRAMETPGLCALATLPDLNGDGLRELVLGDPLDFAGRGTVELVHPVSGGTLSTLRGGQVSRWFGAALAACDVLGEGVGPGLAIAAVKDDRGALNGGSVALFTLEALPRRHR